MVHAVSQCLSQVGRSVVADEWIEVVFDTAATLAYPTVCSKGI